MCVIVDGIVITVTSQKNSFSCFKENAGRHVNTKAVNYLSLGAGQNAFIGFTSVHYFFAT